MQALWKSFWADENGFIISSELVLVGTIVGLGMIVGLAELSAAVNYELHDVAQGFAACNMSPYSNNNNSNNSSMNNGGISASGPQAEQSSGGDMNGSN